MMSSRSGLAAAVSITGRSKWDHLRMLVSFLTGATFGAFLLACFGSLFRFQVMLVPDNRLMKLSHCHILAIPSLRRAQ